jgi:hypothetical protein
VFGLACVTFEMLIGETPGMWPAEGAVRMGRFLDASADHRERLDELPGRLEQTLVKALAMRPADRYESPGEFAIALAGSSEHGAKLADAVVRDVVERAAALDAEHLSEEGALSVGGVEQVAAEAGIAPAHVRGALEELERVSDALPAESGARGLSKPEFRKGRLSTDRTIPGRLAEADYEMLVDEIQRALGFVGSVSRVGGTLNWNGTKPGFVGRDVRVTITRGQNDTRVHVEEHIDLRGFSMFAPAWGAAGGALVTLGTMLSLGLPDVTAILAIPMAFAGAALTATGIPRGLARKYAPQLENLADRLAAQVQQRALPGASDHDNG